LLINYNEEFVGFDLSVVELLYSKEFCDTSVVLDVIFSNEFPDSVEFNVIYPFKLDDISVEFF
jgi:hypothetical protein